MLYNPPVGGAANDPYVDANPATGVEGSPVPAAALEDPQREIVAVIEAAGLVPSAADLSQLGQAIVNYIKFEGITASQYLQYNASAAIPAAAAGAVVEFTGATASQTLTLPPKGDVRNADRIEVFNYGTVPVSVAGNGAEGIVARDINFSPIVLQPGDSIVLSAGIGAYWFVVGGSALNGIADSFKFSLASNGYQRLPSGLIVQWGSVQGNASAPVVVTLPIAWPTGYFSIIGAVGSASPRVFNWSAATTTQFQVDIWTLAGVRQTDFGFWIAIGR